ncbi:MAG: Na+/H+ antiporter NhaC family protein, partial [Chlorobi bacterium]|nr:Na+/H+ antiporter NhaC family protein [Chlorobiota bacterium]
LSDTTILSSLASGCPIIDHVKTQLPYAITVATVALVLYLLWSLVGVSPYVLLIVGLIMIVLIILTIGIPVSSGIKRKKE